MPCHFFSITFECQEEEKVVPIFVSSEESQEKEARQKENVVGRNGTMSMIERATQRVGPLKKNLRNHQKGTKDRHGTKKRTTTDGIRKWSLGERALRGSGETLREILYEIYGPKNTKQIPMASSRTRRIMNWTLWKGRPPLKRKKKESAYGVRAGYGGARPLLELYPPLE
jgi:hypothetical protein